MRRAAFFTLVIVGCSAFARDASDRACGVFDGMGRAFGGLIAIGTATATALVVGSEDSSCATDFRRYDRETTEF